MPSATTGTDSSQAHTNLQGPYGLGYVSNHWLCGVPQPAAGAGEDARSEAIVGALVEWGSLRHSLMLPKPCSLPLRPA